MRSILCLERLIQSKRSYLLAIIFMSSLLFAPFADTQSALAKDILREATNQERFNEVNRGGDDLEYVPNQVLVHLNGETREADVEALKGELKAVTLKRAQTLSVELWQISELSVEDVVQRYQNDARIRVIEPNYLLHLTDMVPDDPSFAELWGLHQTAHDTVDADIDAAEAWTLETGSDVVVAVLDTGVDYAHEDLAANMWVNLNEIPANGLDDDDNGYIDDVHGYDFYNDDGSPMDDNNHGTHVAGTIAAVGNNGIGVTGVSWSARIMGLKICNENGACPLSDAILAIEYATLMGAQVSNNSWGSSYYSGALYNAIAETQSDHLFVAAAGNNGRDIDEQPFYPAGYDLAHIISVAATNQNNQLASFSNYGAISVDVGAPGRSIYSTKAGDSYGFSSGTSMAAPHLAGLASLLLARYPDFEQQVIKQRILSTVEPIEELATVSGGKINAYQALLMDSDGDGVDDEIEDAAPYGGDGNQDGALDSQQNHVASLTNINDSYITVVSPVNHVMEQVKTKANPAPESLPADVHLTEGLLAFMIEGVEANDPMTVTLILHQNGTPSLSRSYWHYVPSADETTAEWQEFIFDGTTGAEFEEHTVTLHLVDSELGDDDLNQNGQLHHSGALSTLYTPPTSIQLADFDGQTSPQGTGWLALLPLLLGVALLVKRIEQGWGEIKGLSRRRRELEQGWGEIKGLSRRRRELEEGFGEGASRSWGERDKREGEG